MVSKILFVGARYCTYTFPAWDHVGSISLVLSPLLYRSEALSVFFSVPRANYVLLELSKHVLSKGLQDTWQPQC